MTKFKPILVTEQESWIEKPSTMPIGDLPHYIGFGEKAKIHDLAAAWLQLRIREMFGEKFLHTPNTEDSRHQARLEIQSFILDLEEANVSPESFFHWDIFTAKDNPNAWRVVMARNYAKYPMDHEEFRSLLGHYPSVDDLHRINCTEAGEPGHHACGWDLENDMPRFMTGCLKFNKRHDAP